MLCCTMFLSNAFLTIVILTGVVSHAKMIFLTTGDIFDQNWTESTRLENTLSHTLETDPNDPCDSRPCENLGICYVKNGNITCICRPPFYGDFCEKDPCDPNPCLNDGLCMAIKAISGEFFCKCQARYTGDRCEIDDTTTTMNPSIIYERISSTKGLGSSRYTAEFTGETESTHLTIGPDSCYPNPCQNGGTCYIDKLFKDKDKVRCICYVPYYGRFCENFFPEHDPCVPNPCKNGGICYFDNNQHSCMCKKRFYGKFCEGGDDTSTTVNPSIIYERISSTKGKSVIEEWKDITLISVTWVTLFMIVVIATCLSFWWVRLSKRSAESV